MNQSKTTILIADDDLVFREHLRLLLLPLTEFELVQVCEDAWQALQYLQTNRVDIALLDVEMPGLTGMELARSLSIKPLFIFITSHTGYAIEGFESDAVDYILKPIRSDRLIRALMKAKKLLQEKTDVADAAGIQDPFVFVRDKNDYIRIALNEVLYIEAAGDFVQIYFENGSRHLVLVNLKNLEGQLPPGIFFRISRTHMVHLQKISAIRNQCIEMGQLSLPIGKSYWPDVEQYLLQQHTIKRFPGA